MGRPASEPSGPVRRRTHVAGLPDRILARVDATLDRHLGYHPLAIRLNHRHGFHTERMQPGHPNWMLDPNRDSHLPHRPSVDRAMEWWFFSPRRHVPRRLLEGVRRDCSGLVLSNVQPASAVPFLTAARRLSLPVVGHVASWDHTVGKGVISPHCDLYVVQRRRVMEDDLRRYHGIEPERVRVTGWPQTDLLHRMRGRDEYHDLLRRYGLDPGRPLVLAAGNTPSNAPYEGRFVERLVEWWRQGSSRRVATPVPSSPTRRLMATAVRGGRGTRRHLRAGGELLRHRRPRDAAPARRRPRLQRRHDSLGRARGRPSRCTCCAEGESWAAKNIVGKHYDELATSGAFYPPRASEEVVAGIERALVHPHELAETRRRAVADIVGVVDGHAAERVVASILEAVRISPAGVPEAPADD